MLVAVFDDQYRDSRFAVALRTLALLPCANISTVAAKGFTACASRAQGRACKPPAWRTIAQPLADSSLTVEVESGDSFAAAEAASVSRASPTASTGTALRQVM